jgi:replication initiation and membrane attachment protein
VLVKKNGLNFSYLRQLINKEKRPNVSAEPKETMIDSSSSANNGSFSPQELEVIAQSKKLHQ